MRVCCVGHVLRRLGGGPVAASVCRGQWAGSVLSAPPGMVTDCARRGDATPEIEIINLFTPRLWLLSVKYYRS